MTTEPSRQSIVDEEHLKLLSIGYIVSGGFTALFSLFGLFYALMGVAMGMAIAHAPEATSKAGEPPPALFGWIFAGVGLVMFLGFIAMAVARFWVARCIRRRKARTFCLVIAGLGCLEIPYGTLLGVATFIALGRDSVEQLFAPAPPLETAEGQGTRQTTGTV